MIARQRWWVEGGIVGGFLGIAVLLAATFHLPFVVPDVGCASFIGIHYIIPLFTVGATCLLATRRRVLAPTGIFLTLPAYAIVLWLHFNMKLWVPLINPHTYDAALQASDQAMRPIVDAALGMRAALGNRIWGIDRLYINGFILMFYVSFIVHAAYTPAMFRTLMRAVLLLQALGALAYLAFPAIGPFLYETGVNPVATEAQAQMLAVRHQIQAGGAAWLAANGSRVFVSPLAAMPSLHAGGSALFLYFAWRHCRPLLPLYVPLFAFIMVGAIANRFHYIVDLPAGIALAAIAIAIAERLERTGVASAKPLDQLGQLQPA